MLAMMQSIRRTILIWFFMSFCAVAASQSADDYPNVVGMDVDTAVQTLQSQDQSLQVKSHEESEQASGDWKARLKLTVDPKTNTILDQGPVE